MVSVGTKLYVSDNSGALKAFCIKVLGSNPRKKGVVGDILIVAITKVRPGKKILNHQIKKALLLSTVKTYTRPSGLIVSFPKNCIVLLDDRMGPLANRVNQVTVSNLRIRKYMKIVSISFGII